MAVQALWCVPNTLFGVFDQMSPVVMQVSLDGSYGKPTDTDPRMFAYGGYFGHEAAWQVLHSLWSDLRERFQIEYFRTNELKTRQDWVTIREAFGDATIKADLRCVLSVPSERLLSEVNDAERKRDVFRHVIQQLLDAAPDVVHFALMCDREADLEKEVSRWLERMRWKATQAGKPNAYARIVGVCYMNSQAVMQVQAADLIAGLAREQGERWLRDPHAPTDPLLQRICRGGFSSVNVAKSEFLRDV